MTVINTSDADTDQSLCHFMESYNIECNGVDVHVIGPGSDADGFVTIEGHPYDNDTDTYDESVTLSFRFDDAEIVIY